MKKLIFLFVLFCTLLTGCSSDTDYINTLKEIPVDNILESNTTEGMAVNFMKLVTKSEDLKASDLKWAVDGKTETGKVVTAEYMGNKIYFVTEKNGDYIEYIPLNTYIITVEKKQLTIPEAIAQETYGNIMNLLMDALENQ